MSKPFFDLERIDPDGLRRVGGILRSAGYTEHGVRDRLGLSDISALKLSAYPDYIKHRVRRRSQLDVGILLFLLQGVVTVEELDSLLDIQARKQLRAAGILIGDRRSRTYRSTASLYPVANKLFFTDHRFAHQPWLKARVPRDPVMYLGADSYYLARTTIHRPIRSALDLCSGSGIHAVLAASSAERSVGVDISRRAVNFARLNAMLNDAWNAVFVEGDLYAPVGGERFDLILANPPFVPSPVSELAFRDGGPSGADVLRRIVASLPDFLTSEGTAHIVTHLAEREGEPYLERVRRWLGGANFNLHSLRLGEEDIVDYALSHTQRTFGERYERHATKLIEWVTNLRAQRFKRILAVVLTFQWNNEAPHPPWTQEDEAKPPTGEIASELGRLLAAKQRVRLISDLSTLDTMRAGVPDGLVLVERRYPTGKGFETREHRIFFKDACISPELDIKPLVRDLLERVDNHATVPQVIERLAKDQGTTVGEIDERCRKAFLVMFERGLITLDEISSAGAIEVGSEQPPKAEDPFRHSGEPDGEGEGKDGPAGSGTTAAGNGNGSAPPPAGAGKTINESAEAPPAQED